ncbi:MAG: hypothetical protein K6E75_06645 [Lachnospiraceae bacterium]|nr:hypothetical protein [Lachnospiraceae bacterium]
MTAIGVLLSIIWMCVLPFFGGCVLLPFFRKQEEKVSVAFLLGCGIAMHYAAYEFLTLAGRPLHLGMRKVSLIFAAGALALAILGLWMLVKNYSSVRAWEWKKLLKDPCFYPAAGLVIWHVLAVLIFSVPDPDDAFYSSLSSMSFAYDLLLEKDAYIGLMNQAIQKRYAFSALPIYQAGLSWLSGGLHHLVISHNLFPLVYIPLGYGLYTDIVRLLVRSREECRLSGDEKEKGEENDEKKENRKVDHNDDVSVSIETTLCVRALLTLAVLHTVGDYYIFSQEAYLMTRMWQGKGLFAAVGIPLLFLTVLYAQKRGIMGYAMVLVTMIAIVFMGGTGLFLAPVELMLLQAAMWLLSGEKKKDLKYILLALICCLPELVLAVWMIR